jgi:hypothetical protein
MQKKFYIFETRWRHGPLRDRDRTLLLEGHREQGGRRDTRHRGVHQSRTRCTGVHVMKKIS